MRQDESAPRSALTHLQPQLTHTNSQSLWRAKALCLICAAEVFMYTGLEAVQGVW